MVGSIPGLDFSQVGPLTKILTNGSVPVVSVQRQQVDFRAIDLVRPLGTGVGSIFEQRSEKDGEVGLERTGIEVTMLRVFVVKASICIPSLNQQPFGMAKGRR